MQFEEADTDADFYLVSPWGHTIVNAMYRSVLFQIQKILSRSLVRKILIFAEVR